MYAVIDYNHWRVIDDISQLMDGDSDTTCLPQYSSSMASRANMCECHSISGGHAESTVAEIDPSVVLSFIKSYGG